VSQKLLQILEIIVISGLFLGLIIWLSRRQMISFLYTVGWLILCAVVLIATIFIPFIEPLAEALRVDVFTVVGAVAVIVLLGICVQLSVSISGMQRQIQKLNEDLALQKNQDVRLHDQQG